MNSHENKLNVKIIALDMVYNFVVEIFLFKAVQCLQNLILNLKFKIYRLIVIYWDPKKF